MLPTSVTIGNDDDDGHDHDDGHDEGYDDDNSHGSGDDNDDDNFAPCRPILRKTETADREPFCQLCV